LFSGHKVIWWQHTRSRNENQGRGKETEVFNSHKWPLKAGKTRVVGRGGGQSTAIENKRKKTKKDMNKRHRETVLKIYEGAYPEKKKENIQRTWKEKNVKSSQSGRAKKEEGA